MSFAMSTSCVNIIMSESVNIANVRDFESIEQITSSSPKIRSTQNKNQDNKPNKPKCLRKRKKKINMKQKWEEKSIPYQDPNKMVRFRYRRYSKTKLGYVNKEISIQFSSSDEENIPEVVFT